MEEVKKQFALYWGFEVLKWVHHSLLVLGAVALYLAYQVVFLGAQVTYSAPDLMAPVTERIARAK